MDWLTLLLPPFIDLLKAIGEDDTEAEREAMINLERKIAEAKALKKYGPRPPSGPPSI